MKSFLKFFGLLVAVAAVAFVASLWISGWSGDRPELTVDRFRGEASEYYPSAKGATKLTSDEASFPYHPPATSEIRYYHARSGDVKVLELGGTPTRIATIAPRALSLAWSRDGNEVIAEYAAGNSYYNLTTGTQKKLDTKIKRPVFSKSSNDVVYLFFNDKTGEGNISIADAQFSSFKNILKTRLATWNLEWLEPRRLSLIATTDKNTTTLFTLDTQTSELTQLVGGVQELQTNWSPDGKRLLYSKKARKGTDLFMLSASDGTSRALGVPGTASQCAWASDGAALYCGSGAEASFYKIDAATLAKETLATPEQSGFVSVQKMFYVATESMLVFKNTKDGRLYALSLER